MIPSQLCASTVNDGFAECRINYQQNGRLAVFAIHFLLRDTQSPIQGREDAPTQMAATVAA